MRRFLRPSAVSFSASAIDTSSTSLMTSLGKKEILCDLKREVPIWNLGEEALGSMKGGECCLSELNEVVQREQKSKCVKERRQGGATRKGPRGSLLNDADQMYNDVVLPTTGDEVVFSCKAISERREKKPRRTPGVPGIKKCRRRTYHLVTQNTSEGLSIADGVRVASGSYSGSRILDVYGIKAKPVNLRPFMTEISLKALLTGEHNMHQAIHESIELQNAEHKGSFYLDINRILQCCLKRPVEAAISRENHCPGNLGGQCSEECGHATNCSSRLDTHVHVKNLAENSSMQAAVCAKVVHRRESLEDGPLVSEISSMWRALNFHEVFSVADIPLKPFGNCIKALKLSHCESLDNLVTQVAGFGVKDQARVMGISSTCNTYTIPPLPYSHPPVGILKADVHRCTIKGKPLQANMMKRIHARTKEFASNGLLTRELKPPNSMHKRVNFGCKTDTTATFHGSMDFSDCGKGSLHVDWGPPDARKEEIFLAMKADPKLVFGNAKRLDHLRKNLEPAVELKLACNESQYTGDVSKIHDTEFSKPVEQDAVNLLIRNASKNASEAFITVREGPGVAQIVGQSQIGSSGSVKHEVFADRQGVKAFPHFKNCCGSHISHASSSMSADLLPPEAFAAACILYHMANELPFSSLRTVDKKGQRKFANPASQSLKSASVPFHNNVKGHDRCKASPTLNKCPVAERKKSLSQVGSAIITPAKPSICTIPWCADWTQSGSLKTVVASRESIILQADRGGQMHSRGSSRVSGNGPTSHVLPPTKSFIQTLPKSSQRFGPCTQAREL